MRGQVLDAFLGFFAFRDVQGDADAADNVGLSVAEGFHPGVKDATESRRFVLDPFAREDSAMGNNSGGLGRSCRFPVEE